jgi:signal transduction histidine kinase
LRRYLNLAEAQHRRLTLLVRAQLDLALLESSALPFDPHDASLSDLIADVSQKFGEAVARAGVTLQVEASAEAVYARVDVGLVARVLENSSRMRSATRLPADA